MYSFKTSALRSCLIGLSLVFAATAHGDSSQFTHGGHIDHIDPTNQTLVVDDMSFHTTRVTRVYNAQQQAIPLSQLERQQRVRLHVQRSGQDVVTEIRVLADDEPLFAE